MARGWIRILLIVFACIVAFYAVITVVALLAGHTHAIIR